MKSEIRRLALSGDLPAILEYMQHHGQSVLLNWGEDDNLWECSWITGGERFTGWSNRSPLAGAVACLDKVAESLPW